jgi:hypothetical protein
MNFSFGTFSSSLQTWDNPSSYAHLNHKCGKHTNYSSDFFEVELMASIVAIMGSSFLTIHVSTLWLSCTHFVQCLQVFLGSIYGFFIAIDLEIYGTNNAF